MDDSDSCISVGRNDEPTCSSVDSCTPHEGVGVASHQGLEGSSALSRNPTCSLCRNHGVIKKLKGHKRYCPWRTCPCELCRVTNKKRKINAAQVALRRAQAADEERVSAGESGKEDSAPAVPDKTATSPVTKPEPAKKVSQNMAASRPVMGCQAGPVAFGQHLMLGSNLLAQSTSFLLESLLDPQVKLRLTPDFIPVLEQVLRDARSATEEVVSKLTEAQKELHNVFAPDVRYFAPLSLFGDHSRGVTIAPASTTYHGGPPPLAACRSTVITGPTNFQGSLFHTYGSLDPLPSRRVP